MARTRADAFPRTAFLVPGLVAFVTLSGMAIVADEDVAVPDFDLSGSARRAFEGAEKDTVDATTAAIRVLKVGQAALLNLHAAVNKNLYSLNDSLAVLTKVREELGKKARTLAAAINSHGEQKRSVKEELKKSQQLLDTIVDEIEKDDKFLADAQKNVNKLEKFHSESVKSMDGLQAQTTEMKKNVLQKENLTSDAANLSAATQTILKIKDDLANQSRASDTIMKDIKTKSRDRSLEEKNETIVKDEAANLQNAVSFEDNLVKALSDSAAEMKAITDSVAYILSKFQNAKEDRETETRQLSDKLADVDVEMMDYTTKMCNRLPNVTQICASWGGDGSCEVQVENMIEKSCFDYCANTSLVCLPPVSAGTCMNGPEMVARLGTSSPACDELAKSNATICRCQAAIGTSRRNKGLTNYQAEVALKMVKNADAGMVRAASITFFSLVAALTAFTWTAGLVLAPATIVKTWYLASNATAAAVAMSCHHFLQLAIFGRSLSASMFLFVASFGIFEIQALSKLQRMHDTVARLTFGGHFAAIAGANAFVTVYSHHWFSRTVWTSLAGLALAMGVLIILVGSASAAKSGSTFSNLRSDLLERFECKVAAYSIAALVTYSVRHASSGYSSPWLKIAPNTEGTGAVSFAAICGLSALVLATSPLDGAKKGMRFAQEFVSAGFVWGAFHVGVQFAASKNVVQGSDLVDGVSDLSYSSAAAGFTLVGSLLVIVASGTHSARIGCVDDSSEHTGLLDIFIEGVGALIGIGWAAYMMVAAQGFVWAGDDKRQYVAELLFDFLFAALVLSVWLVGIFPMAYSLSRTRIEQDNGATKPASKPEETVKKDPDRDSEIGDVSGASESASKPEETVERDPDRGEIEHKSGATVSASEIEETVSST